MPEGKPIALYWGITGDADRLILKMTVNGQRLIHYQEEVSLGVLWLCMGWIG